MKLVMKSLMPPWNNQDAEELEDDDDEVDDEELEDDDDEVDDEDLERDDDDKV